MVVASLLTLSSALDLGKKINQAKDAVPEPHIDVPKPDIDIPKPNIHMPKMPSMESIIPGLSTMGEYRDLIIS